MTLKLTQTDSHIGAAADIVVYQRSISSHAFALGERLDGIQDVGGIGAAMGSSLLSHRDSLLNHLLELSAWDSMLSWDGIGQKQTRGDTK